MLSFFLEDLVSCGDLCTELDGGGRGLRPVDIMIAEACANMIQEDVEDPGMVIMEVCARLALKLMHSLNPCIRDS